MFLSNVYKDTATYWAPAAIDGYGNRTFAAPVLLAVRWQDGVDLSIQARSDIVSPVATVFTQQDVGIGGYLASGNQTAVADPTTLSSAYLIKRFETTLGLTSNEEVRKVIL